MGKDISEIISLPLFERQRYLLKNSKSKRKHNYAYRKDFTEEEIIDFLIEHEITTKRDLDSCDIDGAPNSYDCIKLFGSWSAVKSRIVQKEFVPSDNKDPEYLIKSVIQFGLWTQESWIEARKKYPDVIPSIRTVRKEFVYYSELKKAAKSYSIKLVFDEYVSLWKAIGKKPLKKHLKEFNLDISVIVNSFGGKEFLDDRVEDIIRRGLV